LHVDPGTVSAALKRLESKDLLERRRDPRDHRRITLGLTAQGRALDVPIEGTVEAAVKQLLQETKPEEVASMVRVVEQLTELLESELSER
jgi:MarR family transcriptional regulator, organic hydroperoxide resistance regulator